MATEPKARSPLGGVALAAALVVIAVWLGLLLWLVGHSDTTEVIWARWHSRLASLEAVAFAAAGAVFGTTVQRQRVAEAKEREAGAQARAARAEEEAKGNAKDAINGRALATAVKRRGKGAAAAPAAPGAEPYERVAARRAGTEDDLVALAEELFPD